MYLDPDPIRKCFGRDFMICTDPDPSIIKQNSMTNFDFYCFVTSL
jgi:hypothetical protein